MIPALLLRRRANGRAPVCGTHPLGVYADALSTRCALNPQTVLAWAVKHSVDVKRLCTETRGGNGFSMDQFSRFLDALLSDAPLPGYVMPPAA